MSKVPQSFWAVVLVAMGVGLAMLVLYHPAEVSIASAVLTIASNCISGGLGAMVTHASLAGKADVTTGNAPVTINQGDAK